MANPFTIEVAGVTVQMHPLYSHAEEYCQDYLVKADTPDLVIHSSKDLIDADRDAVTCLSDERIEPISLYRQIAERLPAFDAFVFHGAAIEYDGAAYLFTAPSGTGKSTHIRLWRKYLGSAVKIVNGDKPILRLTDDGVLVCSTPWAGKERWHRNCCVPLKAICYLERGKVDHIEPIEPNRIARDLLNQVYLPQDGEALDKTLQLLDTVTRKVALYRLQCTMERTAVITAVEQMTGKPFKGENV